MKTKYQKQIIGTLNTEHVIWQWTKRLDIPKGTECVVNPEDYKDAYYKVNFKIPCGGHYTHSSVVLKKNINIIEERK